MPLANTPARYGPLSRAFHWITVLLIFTLFPLGKVAEGWPYETQSELTTKALLFSTHKTLGILALAVALARILWTLTQSQPHTLHPDRRHERFAAAATHWALYLLLILVPLSGWITHAASTGFAPIWWPLGQGLPLIPNSESLAHNAASLHWALTTLLLLSVLLHIAGALKHALIDHDDTLARMAGTPSITPPPAPHHHALPAMAALAAVTVAAFIALMPGTAPATAPTPEGQSLAPAASAPATQNAWTVTEGTIALTITQMGAEVSGSFPDFTAAITYDPNASGPTKGAATAQIAIPSLQLSSVSAQAQGADFFYSATFPTATYSGPITEAPDGSLTLDGTLTLKGKTAAVPLPFTLTITGDTATATGTTTVDRRNFDIGSSYSDEGTLAFPVTLTISLTATRAD